MSEATGRAAGTIHRLLEFHPAHGWQRNERTPLEVDAVFIDESSMMCIELAAVLLDALTDRTRLILVGDANQLPSVGPGRVLADLVEGATVPVARLTTVHRAAAESWVCRNAPRVLTGESLELSAAPDFLFCEAGSAEDAARIVGDVVARIVPGAQVLAPQRTTACGVEALNRSLQALINPSTGVDEWKLGDTTFRRGDRVIQTKNDYKIVALDGSAGVFNGEVGEILSIGTGGMVVDFGDRSVEYSKGQAIGLDLAYALTVHKSQGSEFPWVVVVAHSSHSYMLTRQLFYTGITRAKKGVVLVGDQKGLRTALSGKEPPKRNTSLIEQMIEHGAERIENEEPAKVPASVEEMGEIAW
jgi:exodeoxyribonuclease V alpha subunit